MHSLLFVARVTFICNIFFILCLLIRHSHFTVPEGLNEFVIIAGWIMSFFLNLIFVCAAVVVFAKRRKTGVPLMLLAFNTFWFLFQIFYFLLLEK